MARQRRGAVPANPATVPPNEENLRADLTVLGPYEPDAVTAAATTVKRSDGQALSRLAEQWQTKAYTYYDLIGEIHYASNFYARGMTGVRLYAAERDEKGRIQETEDPDAIAAVERITDPGGSGNDQLRETYGRIMFIAGSGYMIWQPDEDGGGDSWEFVSADELRINEGKVFYRYRGDGMPPESIQNADDEQFAPVPGEVRVWRYHTPHPRLSMMADSPMRAILDLCEELWLLTRVVRARVKSRLAGNGILKVPVEISPLPVTAAPTTDGSTTTPPSQTIRDPSDPRADPFIRRLIEHLVAPIGDDGSPSSVTPLVVRGPAVALKELDHLTLSNAEEKFQEVELRNEAIRRIALGLDMPPEALLGMADANHWTGWLIDEQTWENIRPIVQGFCRNITSSYLVPELEEQGKDDAARFLVWYDPSDLLTDPDRGAAADAAHDRGVISDAAYRDARGFKETDAPSEEEIARRTPAAVEEPDTEDQGEPGTEDSQDEEDSVTAGLAAKVLGAAEVTIDRARDLAGSRIAALVQGKDGDGLVELRRKIIALPKGQLAHAIGPDVLIDLGCTEPLALVAGSSDPMAESLRRWGFPEVTVGSLCHLVELHAAMTLTEEKPRPLPAAFLSTISNGQTNGRPKTDPRA